MGEHTIVFENIFHKRETEREREREREREKNHSERKDLIADESDKLNSPQDLNDEDKRSKEKKNQEEDDIEKKVL